MRPPALEVFYRLWLLYLRVLNFISLRYQLDLLWASFFKKKKIVKRFVENYLPLGNSTLKHFPHESYIPLILIIFCFDGKRASFLHVEKVSCENSITVCVTSDFCDPFLWSVANHTFTHMIPRNALKIFLIFNNWANLPYMFPPLWILLEKKQP